MEQKNQNWHNDIRLSKKIDKFYDGARILETA